MNTLELKGLVLEKLTPFLKQNDPKQLQEIVDFLDFTVKKHKRQ